MTSLTYIVRRAEDYMHERLDNERDCGIGSKCEEKCLEESYRSGLGLPLLGRGWGWRSVEWVSKRRGRTGILARRVGRRTLGWDQRSA